VGKEPATLTDSIADFCREIEAYLRRKNEGHLIRIVGPSFAVVSGWAERGIPLKVACEGIDRYFERYYRNGARRRPVKIDFCDADVLDVFDEWRRAVGAPGPEGESRTADSRRSLPDHLERAVTKLTGARASGAIGAAADAIIDRVSLELDAARAKPGGVRGEARSALVARLAALDRELVETARTWLDAAALAELTREADGELAPFRAGTIDRLVRSRFALPTVSFE
jgi:hypothetical protein